MHKARGIDVDCELKGVPPRSSLSPCFARMLLLQSNPSSTLDIAHHVQSSPRSAAIGSKYPALPWPAKLRRTSLLRSPHTGSMVLDALCLP